jgi:hypothetical protein
MSGGEGIGDRFSAVLRNNTSIVTAGQSAGAMPQDNDNTEGSWIRQNSEDCRKAPKFWQIRLLE